MGPDAASVPFKKYKLKFLPLFEQDLNDTMEVRRLLYQKRDREAQI